MNIQKFPVPDLSVVHMNQAGRGIYAACVLSAIKPEAVSLFVDGVEIPQEVAWTTVYTHKGLLEGYGFSTKVNTQHGMHSYQVFASPGEYPTRAFNVEEI